MIGALNRVEVLDELKRIGGGLSETSPIALGMWSKRSRPFRAYGIASGTGSIAERCPVGCPDEEQSADSDPAG